MRIDASEAQAAVERLLTDFPELLADHDLKIGMIEGETDALRVVDRIIAAIGYQDSMAAAITARIRELQQRRDRCEGRVYGLRATLLKVMDACQVTALQRPEATLSVRPTPPSVVIDDEAALPSDMFRVKREPNKTAIKDRLAAGDAIPGAHLSNGGRALSLRVN